MLVYRYVDSWKFEDIDYRWLDADIWMFYGGSGSEAF
jgi:hypothetical protein